MAEPPVTTTPSAALKWVEMSCAVCGPAAGYRVIYPARMNSSRIDFSARRTPDRIHARVVACDRCGLVFSNPMLAFDQVEQLYKASEFRDEPQLENMRQDYGRFFKQVVPAADRQGALLEIGCSSGFFLKEARQLGFTKTIGVEPGIAATAHADPAIRDSIICDQFHDALFPAESFDVVCVFQAMDHFTDPNAVLRASWKCLKPGGRFLTLNHNVRAVLTRFLGEGSGMFDIAHVYLFDPRTIAMILEKNGFVDIRVRPVPNRYCLSYALKMLPLPAIFKHPLTTLGARTGLANLAIPMWGGNMLASCRKPGR